MQAEIIKFNKNKKVIHPSVFKKGWRGRGEAWIKHHELIMVAMLIEGVDQRDEKFYFLEFPCRHYTKKDGKPGFYNLFHLPSREHYEKFQVSCLKQIAERHPKIFDQKFRKRLLEFGTHRSEYFLEDQEKKLNFKEKKEVETDKKAENSSEIIVEEISVLKKAVVKARSKSKFA